MSLSQLRSNAPETEANEIVLRRLEALAPLSPSDVERVLSLPLARRASAARSELCGLGEPSRPRFLIQGWACRVRMMPDGRRQIFDLVLPGDLLGSCLRPSQSMAAATIALTRVETASAAPFACAIAESSPPASASLIEACAALERQGELLLLDQITRLGRQTAYERTAHLMLEVWHRLSVVGLVTGNTFPMPLRQDTLADLLGLSVVHVNRTLQQMRRDRVIELRGGSAVMLLPERLRAVADFTAPLPSFA